MKEPTLIIMAAGMGSRYGGLKQVDPVSDKGEIILDFSLYDAMMAGFKRAIFVIREEMEEDFRKIMDQRAGKYMQLEYAFQQLDDLPDGFEVPAGREKPWGTAHAVMSCRNLISGPFAVINADDYYGAGSFQIIYDYLSRSTSDYDYCMVGFLLENTVTENGHVARGICNLSPDGNLTDITERTRIVSKQDGIAFTEDDGKTWTALSPNTKVSMNFWGFNETMMKEMEKGFPEFLQWAIKDNPLKGEYFLPGIVDRLIRTGKATVKVLGSSDKWYGVTYKEDKENVVAALQSMKDKGLYPEQLWK